MTTSPRLVPILLIEDEATHVKQIEERLSSRFAVESLSSLDPPKLYNYKSLNQESQIVIVDLNLGASKDFDPEEGLKLIRQHLWPVDRTTLFIVFSVYIDEHKAARLVNLNRVDPHWTFVPKEVANGKLTKECLKRLYEVVESCARFASPILHTPRHDSYYWTEPINTYLHRVDGKIKDYHRNVAKSIIDSVQLLNDLSQAAALYAKAGEQARSLAVGVYGSFGRLESRPDSDVEFSVYFETVNPPISKLAVTVWNRMMSYINSRDLKFEGKEEIEKNESRMLDLKQVNVDLLPNGYCPVMSKDRIVTANLSKEAHIRNRHFQTLTELRPVFNPAFLIEMKKQILFANIAPNIRDVATIIEHPYLMEITDQFFTDAKPKSLGTWKEVKRFCYRTLNVIALRFFLIEKLAFEEAGTLHDEKAWIEFLDGLCEPGIVKIIRFANHCLDDFPANAPEREAIVREFNTIIQLYLMLLSRFLILEEEDLATGVASQRDMHATQLKTSIRELARNFVSVLKLISAYKFFDPHQRSSQWLFSTERIEKLMNDI